MRHKRSVIVLALAGLALAPLPALALDWADAGPALPAAAPATSIPSSWPAVPVAERLQPWLAQQLAAKPTERIRVSVSGETTEAAVAAVEAVGLTVQQTWDSVGIVIAVGSPAQVQAVVTQPGVTYVEGDVPLAPALSTAHVATRSDQALASYTHPTTGGRVGGKGVSVAVIDSGIDGTHPFFQADGASKVVANYKNVCTSVNGPTEVCFVADPVSDTDTTALGGHGTHVAGIVAGSETTLADGRVVRGSAPDASLVGLSVGAVNAVINANAAMNWVVEHHSNPCRPASEQSLPDDDACPPIRVTNHSYGPVSVPNGGHTFVESSATVRIQRTLVEQDVTVVWAAGNSDGDGSVATTNPPGMDPTPGVLMVASYNDGGTGSRDNGLSSFSSRGKASDPTTWPDLSAPGDLITSACRPHLPICATGLAPENGPGATDIGTFNTISGTSMATPYVAGVVAQLVSVNPALTPAEIEDLLEDNAYQFGEGYTADAPGRNDDHTTSFDKGHGLVDVAATLGEALNQPVPGAPAPVCNDGSFQVSDREGDAVQALIIDTPLPTEPALDVRQAWLDYDAAAQTLTFTTKVTDLPETHSGAGEYFRFYATRAGDPEVYAVASRGPDGETFSLSDFAAGTSARLTGSFDAVNDVVRVVLPLAAYGDVVPGKAIAEGDVFTVGQVLAQREIGVLTVTTDTATGSCPFVVGTSTPGETTVDPTDSASPTATATATSEPTESATAEPTESATAEPTDSASPSPSPTCDRGNSNGNNNGKACKKNG